MLSVFPKISENLRHKFQEKTIYFLVGLVMYPAAFSAPIQLDIQRTVHCDIFLK